MRAAQNPSGWTLLSNSAPGSRGFSSYRFCQDQCGYDMGVYADPANPDTVILVGSMNYDELQVFGGNQRTNGRAVIRSTDAGETFNDMTNDATVRPGADTSLLAGGVFGMHPDQHALAFDPFNTRFFFVGSDGGVVRVNGRYTDRTGGLRGARAQGHDLKLCRQVLRAIPVRTDSLNDSLRTLQYQSVSLNPASAGATTCSAARRTTAPGRSTRPAARASRSRVRAVGGDGGVRGRSAALKVQTSFGPTMDANFGRRAATPTRPRAGTTSPSRSTRRPPREQPRVVLVLRPAHEGPERRRHAVHRRRVRVAHAGQRRRPRTARLHCRTNPSTLDPVRGLGADRHEAGDDPGDYIVAIERAPPTADAVGRHAPGARVGVAQRRRTRRTR